MFLSILDFGYWPLFARILAFREHPALETCLYARFLLDRFCAGYDSASQAGGGTEEPIYSQALLLEPRHGLPPPPPQIALRFAAQINLEGQQKIQATALWAVSSLSTQHSQTPATGRWLVSCRLCRCAANRERLPDLCRWRMLTKGQARVVVGSVAAQLFQTRTVTGATRHASFLGDAQPGQLAFTSRSN